MEMSWDAGWKRWVYRAVALGFGGVFVYSGVLKALDPGRFLISVRSFQMLPDPYAAWMALGLPWLEILAGLAVVTGVMRRGGLLVLNAALVGFAVALGVAWSRGLDVECGCFGGGGETAIVDALLRDAVLLVAGVWLWIFVRRK
ncbi:DoxX family protein [Phragmitibacter flavus]|uniref:DoxX family protein n=1 Tax=Phragmitibacter flavus TaxID=2576071 RepID=A0A5R8KEZ5_9BACT|nr:MauE/DoxX family redox-associated membrane protein [Phragmitibacter flavus]TLD70169.1 DoxX family protein [Phragmitibacter flavus]